MCNPCYGNLRGDASNLIRKFWMWSALSENLGNTFSIVLSLWYTPKKRCLLKKNYCGRHPDTEYNSP